MWCGWQQGGAGITAAAAQGFPGPPTANQRVDRGTGSEFQGGRRHFCAHIPRFFDRPANRFCTEGRLVNPDRKSVVTGKSVSVRVRVGGRRLIKKKKTKTI